MGRRSAIFFAMSSTARRGARRDSRSSMAASRPIITRKGPFSTASMIWAAASCGEVVGKDVVRFASAAASAVVTPEFTEMSVPMAPGKTMVTATLVPRSLALTYDVPERAVTVSSRQATVLALFREPNRASVTGRNASGSK